MKTYLISLLVGLLVGLIYGFFKVRSPAPPVIALIGLLGMLIGEQLVPFAQQLLRGKTVSVSEMRAACSEHMFGELPRHTPDSSKADSLESGRPG